MQKREAKSLNGLWQFAYLGEASADAVAVAQLRWQERVLVPSAFDAMSQHAGKRGLAAYGCELTVPVGRKARLRFGAVSMWSAIYVDGEELTQHHCGYAPFDVELPVSEREVRQLVVLVDNRYDFERIPMHEEYFDFYQYGGILREVKLELLPEGPAYLDYVHILPTEGYRDGEVEIRIGLSGVALPDTVALTVAFDGGPVQTMEAVAVANGQACVRTRVAQPQLWSLTSPHLHQAEVGMVGGDAVACRFGLRHVEARSGKLWLNGEVLQLRGYNRHEWHPNFGPCTPLAQMYNDLVLMRDMGCNFVRGCHYPQDQQFLDLCDELGMLVWEENLGWGQGERTFASEAFAAHHDRTLRNMVKFSANHPSVIIWGFMNEAHTEFAYTRSFFERTIADLRSMDPSRIISWASNHPLDDLNFDLVDLISLNIYPGWYGCPGVREPLKMIEPHWLECFASIDGRGFADKPIIISETGVEGLYGWRDPHNDFFTEAYQAAYLEIACRLATEHPRSSGIALWHFSDARTYSGGYSMGRPRTFNNKGTFDEYRRPKQAYASVKAIFQRAAQGA